MEGTREEQTGQHFGELVGITDPALHATKLLLTDLQELKKHELKPPLEIDLMVEEYDSIFS
ncbi:Uu.00g136950.m01.CDS01 [Anthostomella pinea]|uniref:Uu.00g136950.m01.CDS01 n=1 Tax=Anthostomella pinea TaxID=933095 RepID=A0AAI8VPH6_9PEZI|nr:Uu.00g136950.m01.CDS01 [Anthostomella pinea]